MPYNPNPTWTVNARAVHDALAAKQMTPNQLAVKASVHHALVYNILDGKTVNPMASTLLSIAETLDMDPRALMVRS